MTKLFIVSHTHWDREWYQPFQVFRMRLIRCIDKLLNLFSSDRDYVHFLLDGQTIVLEDYVEARPQRTPILKALVQSGKLDVGPWYVLPDEFLVSGEAVVRNLLRGIRIGNEFGRAMKLGYIPDPFGHIGQMPQILRAFGISTAIFRRGLADEPSELWWEGSDGTRILACYLRDGYDNAAWLPRDEAGFLDGLRVICKSLVPHTGTSSILALNGTDHMEPWSDLSSLIKSATCKLPSTSIIHASLPAFVESVNAEIKEKHLELATVRGELRNPKRHHLLPGVASARMWIKQRNAHAQMLLQKWAEPLTAYNQSSASPIQLAWKYLMQNHPHDSICGCGADETHADMAPRFDWVEQISLSIIEQELASITAKGNTSGIRGDLALVVFNSNSQQCTDHVIATISMPTRFGTFAIYDEQGESIPFRVVSRHVQEYTRDYVTAPGLKITLDAWNRGGISGLAIRDAKHVQEGEPALVDVTIGAPLGADSALKESLDQILEFANQHDNFNLELYAHSPEMVTLEFVAADVPGLGYRTYALRHTEAEESNAVTSLQTLENEFYTIEVNPVDGTITLRDKENGTEYRNINQVVDSGDRGDLYNYCPPENDEFIQTPISRPIILRERTLVRQSLKITMDYALPAGISDDRSGRSRERVQERIETTVSLYPNVKRVDFAVQVENVARDHRLRVEFPTPIVAEHVSAEQAFDILDRPILQLDPPDHAGWIEQPRPEAPMQGFVSVSNGSVGLTLATRGLPEYEARRDASGTTLALTLLRCVGWLSRGDLTTRLGNAGPTLETPGGQEIGTYTFQYSVIPHKGEWENAINEAHAFNSPMKAVVTGIHPGALPYSGSFVNVSPSGFCVSAVKLPEEGSGIIIRGYNPTSDVMDVHLRMWKGFDRATRTNLNEEFLEPVELKDGREVNMSVRPKEIVTLRFE